MKIDKEYTLALRLSLTAGSEQQAIETFCDMIAEGYGENWDKSNVVIESNAK